MNTFELMQELFQNAYTVKDAAILCTTHNNKDIFLAYAKENNCTTKEANAIWKEVQTKSAPKQGNKEEFFDWLASEARTELDAYSFLFQQAVRLDSPNIMASMTTNLNIWSLSDRIRGGEGKVTCKGITRAEAIEKIALRKAEEKIFEEYEEQANNESDEERKIREAYEWLAEQMTRPSSQRDRNGMHPDRVSYLDNDDLTTAYQEAFKATPKSRKRKTASA